MDPQLFLGVIVLIPILVAVLLRVNAAILFMSLCVGDVLVQFMGSDTNSLVSLFTSSHDVFSQSTMRLFLLLVPSVITLIFMFHSVRGSVKALLNIIPSITLGLSFALLVEPLLSHKFQDTLGRSSLWHQLIRAQALVIGVSAIVSLVFLLTQRHGSAGKRYGHKQKHQKHHAL
jgi:hypothetical protein